MEMQVTMENNKLIAEFMGLSIKEGVSYYTDEDDMFPMNIEVDKPYLPYDKSWDWLMPVVDKCMIGDVPILYERVHIYEALTNLSLSETYNAVVKFIKKHNRKKPKRR